MQEICIGTCEKKKNKKQGGIEEIDITWILI